MKVQDMTFGTENEDETRGKQLAKVRASVTETFTGEIQYEDSKRVDPRQFLDDARRAFFAAAQYAGLNAHEALHAWGDVMDVEATAIMEVTASDYCIHKIAQRMGLTVEELKARRQQEQEAAEQALRSVIERQIKRQRQGPGPEILN
jgi:hypothetical protein